MTTPSPRNTLTAPQQRALRYIQRHRVMYHYGPLTPSLNRPKQVTTRQLTPLVSHGIQGRTLLALERRGLVRLEPITPQHGTVIAVPQEDTGA